jgi:hypothetical protein
MKYECLCTLRIEGRIPPPLSVGSVWSHVALHNNRKLGMRYIECRCDRNCSSGSIVLFCRRGRGVGIGVSGHPMPFQHK